MASDDLLAACVDDAAHEIHRRWGEPHGEDLEPLLVRETARAIVGPLVADLSTARRQRDELLEAIGALFCDATRHRMTGKRAALYDTAKRVRADT